MNLAALGWNTYFDTHFELFRQEGLSPARIAIEQKQTYLVYSEFGEYPAKVAGKFRYHAHTKYDFPAVGDWVAVQPGDHQFTIQSLLPRKNFLARKPPISGGRKVQSIGGRKMVVGGATEEQVIAANIDTAFVVMGLDANFNLRRIERYLMLLAVSGIQPVIVLNKADLCVDTENFRQQVELLTSGIPIHVMSALENRGIAVLQAYLASGHTVSFLGSSGVGKSTIINRLLGQERQKTGALSHKSGKGKHITSYRELLLLPTGGILIDHPGMRELQVWGDEEDVRSSFEDIESLLVQCHFRNCSHTNEPGCAIQEAIECGTLDSRRYEHYVKQQQEVWYLTQRKTGKHRLAVKAKKRAIRQKDNQRIYAEIV